MKHFFFIITFIYLGLQVHAQQEFHVFPITHKTTPGTSEGNGSLERPWDLQTALKQSPEIVTSGDTVWLHEGVYNGRYISVLESTVPNMFITVSAYKNDSVILNGNVASPRNMVLEVKGKQVIFKNFEITWLGEFSRDENDNDFELCGGIRHVTGENCRFYNLKIHDNPGLGFGSWKHTAGTIIENCMIFNNGYMSKIGKGTGEGIYVQNKSDDTRLIKNNIIFNNYYKGIEVWSAGKRATYQYVKNITLEGNIIFNSGRPSGRFFDNLIVASHDRNGINVANNISVKHNVFYHNTSHPNGRIIGDAPSLTLGFIRKAPIENVIVDRNVIVGGYNALRILQTKSLNFSNNIIHTGIVQVGATLSNHFQDCDFQNNIFYSRLKKPFRVPKVKDYSLKEWNDTFELDKTSQLVPISEFDLQPILKVARHSQFQNQFNVALFDSEGNTVEVDFSEYAINAGTSYKILDAENYDTVLIEGQVNDNFKVSFPMQLSEFQKPIHNNEAIKTLSNFGVFVIEFEQNETHTTHKEERDNFLERLWKWFGF